jgi:hypothetical protein
MIQGNLNHCRSAQDLMTQTMAEWQVDVGIFAEQYFIPDRWFGDLDGLVAVFSRTSSVYPPLSLLERGHGFVAVSRGHFAIVGVYFSPNRPFSEFETFLDSLTIVLSRSALRQVILAGDINAKSVAWGNPATDLRGRSVQEWAISRGLTLINRGIVHTCVRRRADPWLTSRLLPLLWQRASLI